MGSAAAAGRTRRPAGARAVRTPRPSSTSTTAASGASCAHRLEQVDRHRHVRLEHLARGTPRVPDGGERREVEDARAGVVSARAARRATASSSSSVEHPRAAGAVDLGARRARAGCDRWAPAKPAPAGAMARLTGRAAGSRSRSHSTVAGDPLAQVDARLPAEQPARLLDRRPAALHVDLEARQVLELEARPGPRRRPPRSSARSRRRSAPRTRRC